MMHGELSDKTDDKGGINKRKISYNGQAQKPKYETKLWKGGKNLHSTLLCYVQQQTFKMHTFELQNKAFFKGVI